LVISVIALFVALGGTSYAAITSLPANSVGTKQLKNGAVTATKLAYGQTLPSAKTEVGDWGFGGFADAALGGGLADPTFSFAVPLANGLDSGHVIYVAGGSATHCAGVGHADPGYLCVYQANSFNTQTPSNGSIFNPEQTNAPSGSGANGFGITVTTSAASTFWQVSGTYAVTAP